MPTRIRSLGRGTPNTHSAFASGESQTPPALPDRRDGGRKVGVPWGEFVVNLPKAAHVASAAPPAARFGDRIDFHTEAATRFAFGGIGRGEKVLLVGSRWQYRDILRGLEHLAEDLLDRRIELPWRDRDVDVLEADELQAELFVDDMPDGMRFASFIERACETARGSRPIRVWNDLGARLNEAGHPLGSRAIERLWHQTRQLGYTILCSYRLSEEEPLGRVGDSEGPLGSHSHVVRLRNGSMAVEPVVEAETAATAV